MRVAAAADLALAFGELAAAFERDTGHPVSLSLGSTGMLAHQLSRGAPFDVFAAAHRSYVDQVVANGACLGESRVELGRGRLVLYVGASQKPPTSPSELGELRFVRVAVANPEHAPYGRAALQALTAAGALDAVRPKLVYADNVRHVLQLVDSGNAEVGLSAQSLAGGAAGRATLVDEALHEPLEQGLVICRHGGERVAAERFAAFARSLAGRQILGRYGFLSPEPTPAANR